MPFSVSVRIKTNHITGQEVSEMLAKAMRLSASSTRWRRLLITSQRSRESQVGVLLLSPLITKLVRSKHLSEYGVVVLIRKSSEQPVLGPDADLSSKSYSRRFKSLSEENAYRNELHTQTKLIYSSCRAPFLLSSSPPTVARALFLAIHSNEVFYRFNRNILIVNDDYKLYI